jgi:hypothetical protein
MAGTYGVFWDLSRSGDNQENFLGSVWEHLDELFEDYLGLRRVPFRGHIWGNYEIVWSLSGRTEKGLSKAFLRYREELFWVEQGYLGDLFGPI